MELFAPNVADGYKVGHRPMFPEGARRTYGNLTARADRLFEKSVSCSVLWDHKVVWFGIQGVLQELNEMWQRSFFSKPKAEVIKRYKRRMDNYLGKDKVSVDGMEALHDLGYLPIEVLALPEGSRVNMNVPLYVIANTDDRFYWFTNYLETSMSNLIWKMVTNATIAYEYRRVLQMWARHTGAPKEFVDVQGHDFSYRGVGGPEDGCRSSSGHLVAFCGTDTIPSIDYVEDYYGANVEREFVACSLPATEHAVATANILTNLHRMLESRRDEGLPDLTPAEFAVARLNAERAFVKRLITEVYPDGGISLVCDSFNFWGVVTEVIPSLKEEIMARPQDSLGLAKVVVRPDSGDPVEIICGVEIFSSEEAGKLMCPPSRTGERRKVLFYRDKDGQIWKATDDLGKNHNRTWEDLDTEIATKASAESVNAWMELTAGARKIFPERLYLDAQAPIKPMIYGFLLSLGIKLEEDRTGLFQYGYLIVPHTLSAEERGAVECLWETFGGITNKAGYKELDSHIGLIYGDSITVQRTQEIMRRLAKKGFASSNVVLGIGSYTYQYNTRDTFGQAIKATAILVDDDQIDLYKAPATEGETAKKSAKGFLRVERQGEDFILAQEQEMSFDDLGRTSGELRRIFRNGDFTVRTTLNEVRQLLGGATY
ncbi:putative nicotinate phosphoribosyltransferase [compost metagenome]